MWFQHDRARAHCELCVRQRLDEIQPVRWIGRGDGVWGLEDEARKMDGAWGSEARKVDGARG